MDKWQKELGLSLAQMALLRCFKGPRPGSNLWAFLELEEDGVSVDGEVIDALARKGHLQTRPVSGEVETLSGGHTEEFGDIPDIDFTHVYTLALANPTPA